MKTARWIVWKRKNTIYLSTIERNEIVASLINLKNKLIEQGRYAWFQIEEKVADKLEHEGLDINYNPTSIGLMCEAILDKLPN